MLTTARNAAPETVTVRLPLLHTGQRKALNRWQKARFLVQPCGRGFGKTTEAEFVMAKGGLDGQEWHYGAPDQRRVGKMYRALELRLGELITRRLGGEYLELKTGGRLHFWTLNAITAGQGYHPDGGWIIDEAGLIPYLYLIWTESIRPSLARHKARAAFLGTPKGQNDYFRLWGIAEDDPEKWARYQASSFENPFQDRDELESARRDTPEDRFNQEYMAQFLEDGAGVFKYVKRAVSKSPMPALADLPTDRAYQFSVDLASTQDFSVTTIWDSEDKRPVYIDRRQGDYIPQMEWLAATCKLLNPSAVTMEINGNKAVLEYARKLGIPVVSFVTTNDSKQQIVNALQIAFEHNTIQIPDFPPLVTELMAFESERLPGGRVRYQAPDGLHDDCVMSLAIGWSGLSRGRWDYGGGPI